MIQEIIKVVNERTGSNYIVHPFEPNWINTQTDDSYPLSIRTALLSFEFAEAWWNPKPVPVTRDNRTGQTIKVWTESAFHLQQLVLLRKDKELEEYYIKNRG